MERKTKSDILRCNGNKEPLLYSKSKNAKVGLENQSVYPIHTNFTRLQVYLKSLTQSWAMANRLGNYIMTC
jgi:hypothetical protein